MTKKENGKGFGQKERLDIPDDIAHAVVTAEMAVLRGGEGGMAVFLESSLSRKIIYRHVLRSHYRGVETGVADLIGLTGQSRQNVAHQVGEMKDMGLMVTEICPDKRKRCIRPTEKLMDYWASYCVLLMEMPKADDVAAAADHYLAYKRGEL